MSNKEIYKNLITERMDRILTIINNSNAIPLYYDNKGCNDLNYNKSDIREIIHKKYYDLKNIINKLDSKLLYIKSGSSGHTFKGINIKEMDAGDTYAIKVVAYPKKIYYGDMYDAKRPENAEILMIKLLSYFVIKNQTPHIILPITTFNTSIKPFINLKQSINIDEKNYNLFLQKYKNGDYYQNVSILISEWANEGDLLDFLRNNYQNLSITDWTILFFQIISVLAVIQNKYPSFRHNDMKANNILLHKIVIDSNKKFILYNINGQKYIVPNIGMQIKLWDFDFACIKDVVNNSKVDSEWANKSNITSIKNQYYDIHYFFNTLIKKGFCPQILTSSAVPQEIKDFIYRVLPKKYINGKHVTDRGRLLVDTEYTTPDKLLKTDPLFNSLKSDIC